MNSNKKDGNKFETELCELLAKHHFWAHNMAQTQAGQPADIIAVKKKKAYLIDCKLVSNLSRSFSLSRVEENQHLAMQLWFQIGNGVGWFALKYLNGEIYMVSYTHIANCNKLRLSYQDVQLIGLPFKEWVGQCY